MSPLSKPKEVKDPDVQGQAPMELRDLARLELKRRQLRQQLAEVESRHQQLSREIELKGIPLSWLTQHGPG
jgi:hypothetical protein